MEHEKKNAGKKSSHQCVKICTKMPARAMIIMTTNQAPFSSREKLNRLPYCHIKNTAQHPDCKYKNQMGKSSGSMVPPQSGQNRQHTLFYKENHNTEEGKKLKQI